MAVKPQRHVRAPIERPIEPNADAADAWLGRVSEAATALAAARVGDQGNGTRRSKISVELAIKINPSDRFIIPEVHLGLHSRLLSGPRFSMVGGLLGGLIAVVITGLALEQLPLPLSSWQRLVTDRTTELGPFGPSSLPAPLAIRPETVIARLVVHSSRAVSGEPAPLGLELQGKAEGAIVIIAGLAPGMEVSVGTAVGADAWEMPASDLGAAWVGPPESFVGPIDLIAELRLPDEKISNRQVMHFEWAPAISSSPPSELARDEITQPPLGREELTILAQVSPDVPQFTSGRQVISAPPLISPELATSPSMASQDSAAPETAVEEKAAKDLASENPSPDRSAQRYPKNDGQRSQSATEFRRDGRQTFKGFWDWSR